MVGVVVRDQLDLDLVVCMCWEWTGPPEGGMARS